MCLIAQQMASKVAQEYYTIDFESIEGLDRLPPLYGMTLVLSIHVMFSHTSPNMFGQELLGIWQCHSHLSLYGSHHKEEVHDMLQFATTSWFKPDKNRRKQHTLKNTDCNQHEWNDI